MPRRPPDMEPWRRELAELVDSHGTAGMSTGAEGSLGSHPAHDPSTETITDIQVQADRATVRSVMDAGIGLGPSFHEYRLVRVDRQWRINRLLTFVRPPDALLVDPAEADTLVRSASSDAALPPLSADLQLDLPGLFAAGRLVTPFDEPVPLQVIDLGELTSGSGVLTVRDFGYLDWNLAPLTRCVRPGTYPVQVSRAAHTNIALRLRLADRPTVSWHPAEFTNGSTLVGVDAGNVTILDLATLVGCQAQHVEELYWDQTDTPVTTAGAMFSLTGDVMDAVMVHSGLGDGAYPCYWGVAADGTLTCLVVDFMVLVEDILQVITVPWRPGPVDSPELAAYDLALSTSGHSFVISHRGDDLGPFRVLAPDGTNLMDSTRLGLQIQGDQHTLTWEADAPPPPGSVLEVTVSRGYRHT
jgi:hypothetical protein